MCIILSYLKHWLRILLSCEDEMMNQTIHSCHTLTTSLGGQSRQRLTQTIQNSKFCEWSITMELVWNCKVVSIFTRPFPIKMLYMATDIFHSIKHTICWSNLSHMEKNLIIMQGSCVWFSWIFSHLLYTECKLGQNFNKYPLSICLDITWICFMLARESFDEHVIQYMTETILKQQKSLGFCQIDAFAQMQCFDKWPTFSQHHNNVHCCEQRFLQNAIYMIMKPEKSWNEHGLFQLNIYICKHIIYIHSPTMPHGPLLLAEMDK